MNMSANLSLVSTANDDTIASRPTARPVNLPDAELTAVIDDYSRAISAVAAAVGPAVVSIAIESGRGERGGSGVLISPDGLVLTNQHVVEGAGDINLIGRDDAAMQARMIGSDRTSDLALLQAETGDLPFALVGDSDALEVGQVVLAIGNPLGLASTVSSGVVSARDRALRGRDGRLIHGIVQHTAPLNPGSSGGPLVDSHGRVMGINTAIIQAAQGLGFAVPANSANRVIAQILNYGRVKRAHLGVLVRSVPIERKLRRRHALPSATGAEITEVLAGGPAHASGLRPGDVIVRLGRQAIADGDDLHRVLDRLEPGRLTGIEALRGAKTFAPGIVPSEAVVDD